MTSFHQNCQLFGKTLQSNVFYSFQIDKYCTRRGDIFIGDYPLVLVCISKSTVDGVSIVPSRNTPIRICYSP